MNYFKTPDEREEWCFCHIAWFSPNKAMAVIYAVTDTRGSSYCAKGPVVGAVFRRAKGRVIP